MNSARNALLMYYGIVVWIISAWLTHIIACLSAGKWGFLIAGALIFPVAWIHGTGIWFGVW